MATPAAVPAATPATVDITFSDSGPLGMTLVDDVEEGVPPVRISACKPGGQAAKLGAPIDSIVVAVNGMDMLKTPRLKMLEVIAAEKAKGPVTFTVKPAPVPTAVTTPPAAPSNVASGGMKFDPYTGKELPKFDPLTGKQNWW